MKRLLFGLGATALLAGCSSSPVDDSNSQIMEEYKEAIAEQVEADAPIQDTIVEINRGANTSVPSWFLVPPEDNEERIYAVGTGLSDDMQFSFDKAIHSAKTLLGDKMMNMASSKIQTYIEDSAKGSLGATTKNTVKVSKSGYKGADVSKYKIEKSGVFMDRRDFRTYVLLSLNPQNRDHGEEEMNTFAIEDKAKVEAAMEDL
jgi:hypothetical protein